MDVGFLLRIKGTLEAATVQSLGRPEQGQAASYPRLRSEVAAALDDGSLRDELDRLFPEELSSKGRPWGVQAGEAVVLMNQLAGWLGGLIEAAVLDQRIQAEAKERAKRTGFA